MTTPIYLQFPKVIHDTLFKRVYRANSATLSLKKKFKGNIFTILSPIHNKGSFFGDQVDQFLNRPPLNGTQYFYPSQTDFGRAKQTLDEILVATLIRNKQGGVCPILLTHTISTPTVPS